MREYRRAQEQAKGKAGNRLRLALESELPMEELVSRAREDLESFATEIGLTIIRQVMEAEIQKKVGPWGRQPVRRHGQQPGYVIFGGRKVQLERPRLRSREGKESGVGQLCGLSRERQNAASGGAPVDTAMLDP